MLENHGQPLCTSEIQIWQIEKSLRSYERLELSSNLMVSKIQRQSIAMIGEWYMRRSPPWTDVYWPPAWNCQNAKGCIVADETRKPGIICVAWNDSGNDENVKSILLLRRTIVATSIVEWKFYSLHFDNTWLRINKW